jgi:ribonuclease T2
LLLFLKKEVPFSLEKKNQKTLTRSLTPPFREHFAMRLLAAVLAVLIAQPAFAQRTPPGAFDYYVFALSVAPGFCDVTGNRIHSNQCAAPDDEAYRAMPLTIHGLWPNKRNADIRDQPDKCSTERFHLSAGLRQQLQIYMPGIADDLPYHEWEKHGTCTGLSPDAYFRRIIALAKAADATIGTILKQQQMLGKTVPVTALVDLVAARNPQLGAAMQVDCQFTRAAGGKPSRADITEIHILLAKDFPPLTVAADWPARFVPLSSVGWGTNSGCPGGMGYLRGSYAD